MTHGLLASARGDGHVQGLTVRKLGWHGVLAVHELEIFEHHDGAPLGFAPSGRFKIEHQHDVSAALRNGRRLCNRK